MRSLFLLNIGNTHTVGGCWCCGRLEIVLRTPTSGVISGAALGELCSQVKGAPCLCACVVPEARASLMGCRWDAELRFLSAEIVEEVGFAGVDVTTLGADRVANAVAAVALVGAPSIVLDCGTAITTEVIDGRRRFLGGTIMPGRRLLREALHRHTGQLPLVDLRDTLVGPVGTNTRDAILAGGDGGAVGAVKAVVRRAREHVGDDDCPVVVVGGDAPFFLRHVPGLAAGGEDFTLQGLATTAKRLFGR